METSKEQILLLNQSKSDKVEAKSMNDQLKFQAIKNRIDICIENSQGGHIYTILKNCSSGVCFRNE